MNEMRFVDRVKVFFKAGNGGNGCVSFLRARYIAKGGPDGGNGGNGGSIILKATRNEDSLIDYQYSPHIKLKAAPNGKGRQLDGRNQADKICLVPIGTQVWCENFENLIADLDADEKEFVLVKGGIGGYGNNHYKAANNQTPTEFTSGILGEENWFWLQLKVIAEIGIIGFPNIGKSSLLRNISRATPEVADYPFTTLTPQIGRAQHNGKTKVFADIPGLIENAHIGKGLGFQFLSHAERCSKILHIIDITSENIWDTYQKIRVELEKFSSKMTDKKEIVALSKADLIPEEDIQGKINELQEQLVKNHLPNIKIVSFSNTSKQGIENLLKVCFEE